MSLLFRKKKSIFLGVAVPGMLLELIFRHHYCCASRSSSSFSSSESRRDRRLDFKDSVVFVRGSICEMQRGGANICLKSMRYHETTLKKLINYDKLITTLVYRNRGPAFCELDIVVHYKFCLLLANEQHG